MKIKCTECEYLTMYHRSGGTYSSYGRGEYCCEHPGFQEGFLQRLLETKQDALYVLEQMNEKPGQQ